MSPKNVFLNDWISIVFSPPPRAVEPLSVVSIVGVDGASGFGNASECRIDGASQNETYMYGFLRIWIWH